jgi:hypothetical protein
MEVPRIWTNSKKLCTENVRLRQFERRAPLGDVTVAGMTNPPRRLRIPSGAPPFRVKQTQMRLTEFKIQFKTFLRRHSTWERVLAGIVKAGCEEDAILELLRDECDTKPDPTGGFVRELKKDRREAGRLAVEAQALSHRVERMNKFMFFTVAVENASFLAKGKERAIAVPLSAFDYLPKLLRFYSQQLRSVSESKLDLEELDKRGPELTILWLYIREVTGKAPYKVLSTLLEAANAFLDRNKYSGAAGIEKSLGRWKRDHPHAYQVAREAIVDYVARRKLARAREPHFWETLYENLYDMKTDDIIKKQPRQ